MIIDIGTIVLIIFSCLFLVCGISFFFLKRNYIMGIRTIETLSTEENWRKTHFYAAFYTLFFLIPFIALMFLDNSDAKLILGILLIYLWVLECSIIAKLVTRNYYKQKKLQEEAELKEQIKKESGWI